MMSVTQTQYGLLSSQLDNIADKNWLSTYLKMCFSFVLCTHGSNKHASMRCFYSERQCLLWRGGAQTTDSGSQGERACHCLASLCSINAWHTWKDNSATWFTFLQGNYQLLLNNPEGNTRLFLWADSSNWKPFFFCLFASSSRPGGRFVVVVFLFLCVYIHIMFSWRAVVILICEVEEAVLKKRGRRRSITVVSVLWRATVCVAMLVCLQSSSLESAGLVNTIRTVRLHSVWLSHS